MVRARFVYAVPALCLCLTYSVSVAIAENSRFKIEQDSIGNVIALEARSPLRAKGTPRYNAAESEARAREFLNSNKEELKLSSNVELDSTPVHQDDIGHTRVRLTQSYKGVPVWGKEVIVNQDANGEILYVSQDVSKNLPLDVTAKISAKAAANTALKAAREIAPTNEKLQLKESKLYVLPSSDSLSTAPDTLVWAVVIETPSERFGRTYFVNAVNGKLQGGFSNVHGLNRMIYDCASFPNDPNCYLNEEGMNGYIHGRSEGEPVRGPHNRPTFPQYGSFNIDYNYDLVGIVHDWVQLSFGINGANNYGGTRKYFSERTQTRVFDHSEGWNGNQDPLACPGGAYITSGYTIVQCLNEIFDDVFGHEYGHAISHWSFQSGGSADGVDPTKPQARALAEASSDVWGEAFEHFRTGTADWINGALMADGPSRDLINPHDYVDDQGYRYAQRFYDEYFDCSTTPDNEGYYANSTVYSHAMYLSAEGGEMNGCTVEGQGMDFVKKIYFRAWRNYFARSQGFNTAYTKLLQACADLYTPLQCAELQKALQAVEADQLGICFDPEGASGEDAPACAVNNVGTVSGAWPTGNYATYFAPGETVAVSGSGGIAGKEVDVYLLPTSPTRPVWAEMNGSIAQTSATVDEYGNSLATLGAVSTPGVYDILVDGNQDGNYQPWADSVSTITVAPTVNGDGTCYIGQTYADSENCHDDSSDCGCSSGYICQGSGAPTQYSCVPRPRGTCFLKGAKITMFDGTEKLIEDIKVDDRVLSFDVSTGEYVSGTVENLIRDETKEYVILNGKTKVTPNHRFYVPKNSGLMNVSLSSKLGSSERASGDWIEIGKLSPGAMLLGSDGKLIKVKSIERVKESAPVYNFEVSPNHNYVANGVVVHNRKKLPYQDGYGGQELP